MKIFCSGIGGIGLSAYASLQSARGHEVSGSDRSDSPLLQDLRSQGITVSLQQDGSAVPLDADLFVYSEAIPNDALERRKAEELGIPMQSYFQALGTISKDAFVIAVCGTHGKSSTTAMVARLLMETGNDPTVIVGTKMRELGGKNWRCGKSDFFVLEACEYRRSFHFLFPDIALMTNVDGDHFDAYPTMDAYREAFLTFLRRLPEKGIVITHGADRDAMEIAVRSGRTVVDADTYPAISLKTPGEHMRQNARLALALAKNLGIEDWEAREALRGFAGTWRRMEDRGTTEAGVTVIDDYAHHPVEIRATLAAMKEAYPQRRIIVVFQPHTHDRTRTLYDEFTRAFSGADIVIVPNVYDARHGIETTETDLPRFIAAIGKESGVDCRFGDGLAHTQELVESLLQPGDVLMTMGAGDVTKIADGILGREHATLVA